MCVCVCPLLQPASKHSQSHNRVLLAVVICQHTHQLRAHGHHFVSPDKNGGGLKVAEEQVFCEKATLQSFRRICFSSVSCRSSVEKIEFTWLASCKDRNAECPGQI